MRCVPIVLSSINLKGGVGKTTIAVNYAAYCGNKGRKVLLCDLDPQANASFGMIGVEGWESHVAKKGTVADLLGARRHKNAQGVARGFNDVVIKNAWNNVDLIPSHLDLFTVDLDLAGITAREFQLKKSLKDHIEDYDIVICDCPPNLTLPTQNALAISTNYTVPVSLDYLSVLGIGLLLSRISSLSEDLDVDLTNSGIIISRVGRPAKHRAETESVVRGEFNGDVLSGKITDRTAISAAMEKAQSIYSSGDQSAIAEFNHIFSELDQNLGIK
ncbi:ParA family protein [Paracoccus jeotgali]|uniref:ParA family protein n=1 Tax=Paracoccus jeotgali TaxID=2065379 RepID=A0A2K9MBC2_9RHOB|nr:ParA family protein [Paracoccus jeotgali]